MVSINAIRSKNQNALEPLSQPLAEEEPTNLTISTECVCLRRGAFVVTYWPCKALISHTQQEDMDLRKGSEERETREQTEEEQRNAGEKEER